MTVLKRANMRELILALAFFFNPLLYNEVFAGIMNFTQSYWTTALIMYIIAGSLFGIYLILKVLDKRKEKS
jgi:hypothetical protein